MRRHITTGVTTMIGLAVLSGCASAGPQPAAGSSPAPVNLTSAVGGGPSPVPVTVPPTSAAPETSPPVIVNPPGNTDPAEGVTVIRGQIIAGVEPSCKLLADDKVLYLLLADSSVRIPVGSGAIVNGHLAHGIMTHCQQGIPFVVTSIRIVTAQR